MDLNFALSRVSILNYMNKDTSDLAILLCDINILCLSPYKQLSFSYPCSLTCKELILKYKTTIF